MIFAHWLIHTFSLLKAIFSLVLRNFFLTEISNSSCFVTFLTLPRCALVALSQPSVPLHHRWWTHLLVHVRGVILSSIGVRVPRWHSNSLPIKLRRSRKECPGVRNEWGFCSCSCVHDGSFYIIALIWLHLLSFVHKMNFSAFQEHQFIFSSHWLIGWLIAGSLLEQSRGW
jgi:hypothetical protein